MLGGREDRHGMPGAALRLLVMGHSFLGLTRACERAGGNGHFHRRLRQRPIGANLFVARFTYQNRSNISGGYWRALNISGGYWRAFRHRIIEGRGSSALFSRPDTGHKNAPCTSPWFGRVRYRVVATGVRHGCPRAKRVIPDNIDDLNSELQWPRLQVLLALRHDRIDHSSLPYWTFDVG